MSVSGLKIVSVYDPATGTVVQLNKVSPDGEAKIKAPLFAENTKGGLSYAGDDSSFEFLALDDTGYDQLETWMKNATPVNLVTNGLEDHVLWYEPSLITVKRSFGFKVGSRNGFTVKIAKTGGEQLIYSVANIFLTLGKWPVDLNADGISDDLRQGYAPAPLFSIVGGTSQKITFNQNTTGDIRKIINYPISGAKLYSIVETELNTTPAVQHRIETRNYANSSLLTVNANYGSFASFVTPANTYGLHLFVTPYNTAQAAGTEFQFKCPIIAAKPDNTITY